MKKIVLAVMALALLLTGCVRTDTAKIYTDTCLTLFDTVTTVKAQAQSAADFEKISREIFDKLEYHHRLFDIYESYDGMNNLKTVNDHAGVAPVTVERPIIDLLKDCKRYYALTDGKVNVAMGSVLSLWHAAREAALADPAAARLPDAQALSAASAHTDIDAIEIDEDASTVFIRDAEVQLDVGAVAKGWAAQRVAESAPKGMLISVGGNVCVTGPKAQTNAPWIVGVENPAGGEYLQKLALSGGSVVTSGDYQRCFTVDGKSYHHIIDPQTQMPCEYWRSVSVICADSGLADALSTALFLLPLDAGKALLREVGAEAMWVDAAGAISYSDGFCAWVQ